MASNRAAAAAAGMLASQHPSASMSQAAVAAAAAGMMAMARLPIPAMPHAAMHTSPGQSSANAGLQFPPAPSPNMNLNSPQLTQEHRAAMHLHNMQQQFNMGNINNLNNLNNLNGISNMNNLNALSNMNNMSNINTSMANLPSHPNPHPSNSHRQDQPQIPMLTFMFSYEDLDTVLYGYAKNKVNEHLPGHALSGLRISDLSYGKNIFIKCIELIIF